MNPRNFFKAWIFFKNFDFNKMCKNEIEDNNEKFPADSAQSFSQNG